MHQDGGLAGFVLEDLPDVIPILEQSKRIEINIDVKHILEISCTEKVGLLAQFLVVAPIELTLEAELNIQPYRKDSLAVCFLHC